MWLQRFIFSALWIQLIQLNSISTTQLTQTKSDDLENFEKGLQEVSFLYGISLIAASGGSKEIFGLCAQDLIRFKQGVLKKEPWSIRMLDASGQEETGYLFAHTGWLGLQSGCESIISPFDIKFISTYLDHKNPMMVQYNMPSQAYIQLGLCIPNSCSHENIFDLLDKVVKKKNLTYFQKYPDAELTLRYIKHPSYKSIKMLEYPMGILAIICLTIIFTLTLVGSYYDEMIEKPNVEKQNILLEKSSITLNNNNNYNNNDYDIKEKLESKQVQRKPKLWTRIILCFSFPANVRSLFHVSENTEDSLPVVHGMKAIGMVCILFAHKGAFAVEAFDSMLIPNRLMQNKYASILKKSHFFVDTYFCLGGFLISYLFCKTFIGTKRFNLLQSIKLLISMICHRIIKVVPFYTVILIVGAAIWRIVQNISPIWELYFNNDVSCPKYWWRHLLFISTWWYDWGQHCLNWTWYLSSDMQYYVINCVVLVIALRFWKFAESIVKLLIGYSVAHSIYKSYVTEYSPTIDSVVQSEYMYYGFYIRLAPYFIGVLAGMKFFKWNGSLPLSQDELKKGWKIFTFAVICLVVCLQNPDRQPLAYVAFYVGTGRAVWAACMAWFLCCCITGKAGIMAEFLSLPVWVPMSRSSFSVFISNLIVIYVMVFTGENFEHIVYGKEAFGVVGNMSLLFSIGMLVSILFESPIVKLMKLMTTTPRKVKSQ